MGKLREQMEGDLILKAYSPHTQSAYLRGARHFVRHYMRSPQEMGEQEVRDFLLHLVRETPLRQRRTCMSMPSSFSSLLPSNAQRQ